MSAAFGTVADVEGSLRPKPLEVESSLACSPTLQDRRADSPLQDSPWSAARRPTSCPSSSWLSQQPPLTPELPPSHSWHTGRAKGSEGREGASCAAPEVPSKRMPLPAFQDAPKRGGGEEAPPPKPGTASRFPPKKSHPGMIVPLPGSPEPETRRSGGRWPTHPQLLLCPHQVWKTCTSEGPSVPHGLSKGLLLLSHGSHKPTS